MDYGQVRLVGQNGAPTSLFDKMEAHRQGLLHLAFSVFVFDDRGHVLLQKRAAEKYHSPNLWSNACCSHPTTNHPEELLAQAGERLEQEMGFTVPLQRLFTFRYRAEFPDGLVENEEDTVVAGRYNGPVAPNPAEVADTRWMALPALQADVAANPGRYTYWLRQCLPRVAHFLAAGPLPASAEGGAP